MRKVHDSGLDGLLYVLEANKIFHGLAKDNHRIFSLTWSSSWCVFVFLLDRLASHVVEVGHLHSKQSFLSFIKLDDVLALDSIISGDKEGLEGLSLELFFLLAEVVLDFALFDGCKGGFSSLILFGGTLRA